MKTIFSIMLTGFLALNVSAMDFRGAVGVNSDNYFRGHNISEGLGYNIHGEVDFGKGL